MYIANSTANIILRKGRYIYYAKKGEKWNHIKSSIKTTKGRKRVEDIRKNKGFQIENSTKCGRY